MILFTYGDELEDHQTIDEHLQKIEYVDLQKLVTESGGKFHFFINMNKVDWQVPELLHKIERMVTETSGKCVKQQMKRRGRKENPTYCVLI